MLSTFVLVLAIQQEGPPRPAEEAPSAMPAWLAPLHGRLTLKHRTRWTPDESDSDLYQFLSLSYGNPESDAVTASAGMRFAEDLDGDRDARGFFPFDSLDDSYRHGTTARLYTAYVDFHRPLPGLAVRAGRQILEDIPEALPLDGGHARYEVVEGVRVSAFVGKPVVEFESSPREDLTYGGGVELLPWARGRARFDYLHVKDENAFGLFKDDLVALALEQGVGSFLLAGRFTAIEGDGRDLQLRAGGSFPEDGLILDARLTYLFEQKRAYSFPLDPYSLFLFELEPYVEGTLRASKGFGAHFAVDASVTSRELVDDGDDAPHNHEFARWNVTPRVDGWPAPELSWNVALDFWQSSRDDFWTVGGDASWHFGEALSLGAGSAYALYTVDAFTGAERERVRSVYATARWRMKDGTVLDLRVSVEENDADTFTTFEVGVRHAF